MQVLISSARFFASKLSANKKYPTGIFQLKFNAVAIIIITCLAGLFPGPSPMSS
jgi:hypothetical protein